MPTSGFSPDLRDEVRTWGLDAALTEVLSEVDSDELQATPVGLERFERDLLAGCAEKR